MMKEDEANKLMRRFSILAQGVAASQNAIPDLNDSITNILNENATLKRKVSELEVALDKKLDKKPNA